MLEVAFRFSFLIHTCSHLAPRPNDDFFHLFDGSHLALLLDDTLHSTGASAIFHLVWQWPSHLALLLADELPISEWNFFYITVGKRDWATMMFYLVQLQILFLLGCVFPCQFSYLEVGRFNNVKGKGWRVIRGVRLSRCVVCSRFVCLRHEKLKSWRVVSPSKWLAIWRVAQRISLLASFRGCAPSRVPIIREQWKICDD